MGSGETLRGFSKEVELWIKYVRGRLLPPTSCLKAESKGTLSTAQTQSWTPYPPESSVKELFSLHIVYSQSSGPARPSRPELFLCSAWEASSEPVDRTNNMLLIVSVRVGVQWASTEDRQGLKGTVRTDTSVKKGGGRMGWVECGNTIKAYPWPVWKCHNETRYRVPRIYANALNVKEGKGRREQKAVRWYFEVEDQCWLQVSLMRICKRLAVW